MFISDRRMAKAVQLLQVAAYCDGRSEVSELDMFLTQHLLWQRPDQVDKIQDWVLKQVRGWRHGGWPAN